MAKDKKVLYDRDIREPLFNFLESTFGKVRFLEEKVTGNARADIVMITPDHLYGIEIKSDADTYARLAGQVRNYDLYYDRNIIVAGSSHAEHVKEHIPAWWGIITAEAGESGTPCFRLVRPAQANPRVKGGRKISILWRTELNRLLEENRLPGYREKSKLFVQQKLLERVPDEVLGKQICEELFERDYNTIADEIAAFRKERQRRGRKKR